MSIFTDLLGTINDIFQIGLTLVPGQKTLRFSNGNDADLNWNPTAPRQIDLPDKSGTLALLGDLQQIPITVSASKTLTITDAFTLQYCSNSAAITITVPADATLNFPLWTTIEIQRDGAGTVTFAAASGAFIRRLGSTATTNHQIVARYTSCYLRKVSANEWRLFGAVA